MTTSTQFGYSRYYVTGAAPQLDGEPRFKAIGYVGTGTSSVEESKSTTDKAQAQAWADAANEGSFPAEAGWGCFADD